MLPVVGLIAIALSGVAPGEFTANHGQPGQFTQPTQHYFVRRDEDFARGQAWMRHVDELDALWGEYRAAGSTPQAWEVYKQKARAAKRCYVYQDPYYIGQVYRVRPVAPADYRECLGGACDPAPVVASTAAESIQEPSGALLSSEDPPVVTPRVNYRRYPHDVYRPLGVHGPHGGYWNGLPANALAPIPTMVPLNLMPQIPAAGMLPGYPGALPPVNLGPMGGPADVLIPAPPGDLPRVPQVWPLPHETFARPGSPFAPQASSPLGQ